MEFIYDLCVVGAGMIGSSAAKYASMKDNFKVCLIGPTEPKNRGSTDVFGAHYDEARISRSTASVLIWAQMASQSIARYQQIEEQSGISFYNSVGCLTEGIQGMPYIENAYLSAKQQNIKVTKLKPAEARQHFPYIAFGDNSDVLFEQSDAGYINPRRLVQAQQAIMLQHGADIIHDVVNKVEEMHDPIDKQKTLMRVETDSGKVILAHQILVATGCFTNFRQLLPVLPDITASGQTVVFAEVNSDDMKIMKDMPSYIYDLDSADLNAEHKENGCYILPPVKYPNGRYYIKIGHGLQFDTFLKSQEEIVSWYRQPPPQYIKDALLKLLNRVFPAFRPASVFTDTCCVAITPGRKPFIDRLTPRLAVALGGNGYSAKSSDEFGRLAVEYAITGEWTSSLPRDEMKFKIHKMAAKL